MKILTYLTLVLSIILTLFSACDNNDNPEPDFSPSVKIAEANSNNNNFKAEFFANDTLFEGYNKVFFKINNISDNNSISEAEIKLKPLMDMMTMVHSAPVENPQNLINDNGYFEGAIVLIMPSSEMMGWTLDVIVNAGGVTDTVHFEIPLVKNLEEKRKINVINQSDSTQKYFVSLLEPNEPKIGINDFNITVHYKENMMSFPAAEDLTIEIEPEMPSMDHGSPNNEHPVHQSNGHYNGKINFTMSGWWRVHIKIMKGTELVTDDAYLDITF